MTESKHWITKKTQWGDESVYNAGGLDIDCLVPDAIKEDYNRKVISPNWESVGKEFGRCMERGGMGVPIDEDGDLIKDELNYTSKIMFQYEKNGMKDFLKVRKKELLDEEEIEYTIKYHADKHDLDSYKYGLYEGITEP